MDVSARRLLAPNHDVEYFLRIVQLTNLSALDQCDRGAPNIGRGEAKLRRGLRPQFDLNLRHKNLRLNLQVCHSRYVADGLTDLLGFLTKHPEVLAIHSHHNARAGASEDLLDSLLQIGQHVPIQPGVAVDHLLNPVHGGRRRVRQARY